MSEKKLNLHQKLLGVMKEIDYLQKEKKQGVRFPLLSHDHVTEYVRGPLIAAGIYWATSCDQVETRVEKSVFICSGIVTTTFFNADKPDDCLVVSACSAGASNQDPAKAAGSMMSYGAKYTYLKALGLYSGDEAEPDYDTRNYTPAAQSEPVPAQVLDEATFKSHMDRLSAFCGERGLKSSAVNQDIEDEYQKTVREMTEEELNNVHRWVHKTYELEATRS